MAAAVEPDVVIEQTAANEVLLRVGNSSDPLKVASALAHAIYEKKEVTLRAIGAGAVNQAVKSIAIARGYVAQKTYDLACVPGFATLEGRDGGDLSAIVFRIFVQH